MTASSSTPAAVMSQEAREAGLRYTSDEQPGLHRQTRGKRVVFLDAKGKPVRDPETLSRIKHLVIPPAWTDVWISPSAQGHIQATGRDARGRKQYRYHDRWRQQRDESKFEHMLGFARHLPALRRRVNRDLRLPGMPREKIVATVVRLLEATLIRVGNDEYARQNHSYGLTTMRNRHVDVKHGDIVFSFRGKSGKHHEITLHDDRVARIIRQCQEMPGQELFSYTENGETRHIGSHDVNDYLHAITHENYTAKDFRTWIGTVLAATAFREFEAVTSERQAKKNIALVIAGVSKILGNTPAVCRKAYIHPEIIHSYLEGVTVDSITQRLSQGLEKSLKSLRPTEAAALVLLQHRLQALRRKSPARGTELRLVSKKKR